MLHVLTHSLFFLYLYKIFFFFQNSPTTSKFITEKTIRVPAWYNTTSDLSGLSLQDEEAGWISVDPKDPLPPTLLALLHEVGRFYVPFMLANEQALKRKDKDVDVMLDDNKIQWQQPSFRYQLKCLQWLREKYCELASEDRKFVDRALSGTGVEMLFVGSIESRL